MCTPVIVRSRTCIHSWWHQPSCWQKPPPFPITTNRTCVDPRIHHRCRNKMLSYRRETAQQCALVLGQKWKTGTGRQYMYFTEIISLSSTTVTYVASKAIEFGEKTQKGLLRRSKSFKVTEVCTNRKPVCDFLLVISSSWHHISYRFGVIAACCSNLGYVAFLSPLLGVRDNIRCSSWAHWKALGGLPISVNWTFLLGLTGEALRAKIDRKSAISLQRAHFDPKFQVEGVAHNNYFCTDS